MAKNLILSLILVRWTQVRTVKYFFFTNLAFSVTRYHGQISECKISEKTNDPIMSKFSDGRTDRQTDRQTDECDFIGRPPTNDEHPSRYL